jgi:hypothetical protein
MITSRLHKFAPTGPQAGSHGETPDTATHSPDELKPYNNNTHTHTVLFNPDVTAADELRPMSSGLGRVHHQLRTPKSGFLPVLNRRVPRKLLEDDTPPSQQVAQTHATRPHEVVHVLVRLDVPRINLRLLLSQP